MKNRVELALTLVATLGIVAWADSAFAAESNAQTPTKIRVESGYAAIWGAGGWGVHDGGESTCSDASTDTILAFDTATDEGKAMLSLVTAAFLSGKKIVFHTYVNQCINVGSSVAKVGTVDIIN